jgi:hypothetical protein
MEHDNERDGVLTGNGAMFVPPWSLVQRHVRDGQERGRGDSDVIMPKKLFQFLLQCLLAQMEFNEDQYQKSNPDVAEAIKQRGFANGRDHFIATGYFEDRMGGTVVNETWYLARNPDVAAAKQSGLVESGNTQYRLAGAREWREPNPESVQWIRKWKEVLE